MTESVFLKQRPVGRFSGVMVHGPAEKSSPHGKTITNRKGTRATCKECGFKKLCVLTSLTPTEVPPPPPSPPPSWCCLKCVSPEGCVGARERRPEPTMTNWGNASKTCASIPQDTAEHNRQELVAFCQGSRGWHFIDFRHNNKNNSSAGADD